MTCWVFQFKRQVFLSLFSGQENHIRASLQLYLGDIFSKREKFKNKGPREKTRETRVSGDARTRGLFSPRGWGPEGLFERLDFKKINRK